MTDLSHYADADQSTLRDALREFDTVLPPDAVRVALDVGSRDAQIARGLACHYPNARVWAFEPNPAAVAVCRDNLKDEPRIALVEAAVTEADGPVTFYPIDPARTLTPHADGNIGASSLYKANAVYPYETYAQTEVTVHGTRLDTWAQGAGVGEIDVLWMDVQGAELPALSGLGQLLSRVKIIHVEVLYKEMYVGASLFDAVDALLTAQGFARTKKLYACEWFGDVVYVRADLLGKNPSPALPETGRVEEGLIPAPLLFREGTGVGSSTLVLEPQYGGLGDHLFFSHLPRLAKQFGGYDKVFVSTAAPYRHPDYKRLVWDANPYVDGFTHEHGPAFDFAETDGDGNLLDYFMRLHGIDDGLRGHEPELYFQPTLIPELVGKSAYDPNFVSYVGELDAAHVADFFANEGVRPDFQMARRGDNSLCLDTVPGDIETPTLEDFCSVLFSCKEVYCLASGTATLAAALGRRATVLHGPGQKPMFHHSPRHRYVCLPFSEVPSPTLLPAAEALRAGPPPSALATRRAERERDGERGRREEGDSWLAQKARAVPTGFRILDVGTERHDALFTHGAYFFHDFAASGFAPLPAPDASFDVVVCPGVLEHAPDPVCALREVARLLRPGGTLLLTTAAGLFYAGLTPHWFGRFCADCGLRVTSTAPGGVEAVRPLLDTDWQEQIDRRPSDVSLYREAAWAARAAGDEAAAVRFTEDMEELDPDAVFVFAGGFGQ